MRLDARDVEDADACSSAAERTRGLDDRRSGGRPGRARQMNAMTGLYVPLLARGRAIGVVAVHDKIGPRRALQRRGPAPGRDVREPRAAARRPLRARRARCPEARDGRTGARAPPARARAPRRDRPGAHVAPARATARGGGGRRRAPRTVGRGARARRARRSRTCGGLPSSCGRRRSTTSGSCRRSSASLRRSPSRRASAVDLEADARRRAGCPPRPRPRSTGSSQEALTNVVKHAHATRVSIVLTRKDASVTAVIEDDGRGFDPGSTREGGYGLLGHARARRADRRPPRRRGRTAPARRSSRRSRSSDDPAC